MDVSFQQNAFTVQEVQREVALLQAEKQQLIKAKRRQRKEYDRLVRKNPERDLVSNYVQQIMGGLSGTLPSLKKREQKTLRKRMTVAAPFRLRTDERLKEPS